MNQVYLEERLILAAKLRADRLGWQFDANCLDGHLIPFIKEGVQRLKTGGLLEDEAQIALAEANINGKQGQNQALTLKMMVHVTRLLRRYDGRTKALF